MAWTTRVRSELTRHFGVEEAHDVWFTPRRWPGKGPAVSLLIPECELQVCWPTAHGPKSVINRPANNKDIKYWLRYACGTATKCRATLSLACDTAERAERFAKLAVKLLPDYERVALERMYEVQSRSQRGLN